jgi:quercetin dioxygenase-like cupin family protein
MTKYLGAIKTSTRLLLSAAAIAALSTGAFAGSCPAGKVVAEGQGQKPGATENSRVTDTVIGSIDLANEAPKLADRKFRLRRLVVQPGGTVAWHSHGERPAIIYIVSGTIVEYRSTCAVPIVHNGGDVATEVHTTSHWWKNTTKHRVVLLSADILHDKTDPHQM